MEKVLNNEKRYDMMKSPQKTSWYLRPVTWIMSFPDVWKHHTKITKINMDGLKGSYILICNHNAFFDFKVATAALFPKRANYVVAIDGFINRETLLRKAGCICKRKFTNDTVLVRQLQKVIKYKGIAVIYPEARYSLCGTNSELPTSLGKLIKTMNTPVVTLITHGNHLNSPFWNLKERKNKTEAVMTQIITKEELQNLSVDDINNIISKNFQYDDYQWQKDNNIKISYENRAKGIHKVLYKCPNCHEEHYMNSDQNKIWCEKCNKVWEMDELGELKTTSGVTEFTHIPDWFEWEKQEVKKEIENGLYHFESEVRIDALPNAKKFIPLGNGKLTHSLDGFKLKFKFEEKEYEYDWQVQSLYSCHIEYNYLNKHGDCVDLNTINDTFYIYPLCERFSVTKISFATEEMYKIKCPGKVFK